MRHLLPALLAVPTLLAAQVPAGPAGYVIRSGDDTLVVERFLRTDHSVEGWITSKGQPEFRYMASLGRDGSVDSMNLEVYAPGADADASADSAPSQAPPS